MVEARLFPMYGEHIAYAALSPDGRGLPNYGPIAVRWQVAPAYVGRRASLLEENSFIFSRPIASGTSEPLFRKDIARSGMTARRWRP